MTEYVVDIECNGLNPSKIHCLSVATSLDNIYSTSDYNKMKEFLTTKKSSDYIIGHNFIRFDSVHLCNLLDTSITPQIIDTLALSWYLEPDRKSHGLEEWGEFFGYEKIQIDDWEGLSYSEYKARCERDVEINLKLWEYLKKKLVKLYGSFEASLPLIGYLMFKMKCARDAEQNGWKLDIELTKSNLDELTKIKEDKESILSQALPKVPIYQTKKKPKVYFKKDGKLTLAARRWEDLLIIHDKPLDSKEMTIIKGYEDPNPGSHKQIKDWLFQLGWEPDEYKGDVPQINTQVPGKSGCTKSVLKLIEVEPKVDELNDLFVCRHRISILKGFLRDEKDGYITASVSGFTNTLRFKHSILVNLPSTSSRYGEYIRPCLVTPDNYVLCGSDMSSLEDRTKQHYMYKYDPEYVKEMQTEGFDPHLDLAVLSGMMTKKDSRNYKDGDYTKKPIRIKAKTTNYTCTYGAFPPRIAAAADIPLQEAVKLHATYWKRNWSIKKIAEDCVVKELDGKNWLYNPVSRLWYSLRHEKDRFSTLNQGTGAYVFDRYLYHVLSYKVKPKLLGQFHDEFIILCKKGKIYKKIVTNILQSSIQKVNKELKLNRIMDIDIQFGNNYGEIH